jgi:uncharacterized protein involved in response to NO
LSLLSGGFRIFFLGAAAWAALAMAVWLGIVTGVLALPGGYPPVAWHAHEFLFGYVSAAVAGFLLTTIPNWTGRLPIKGGPLLGLFMLWVAGRVALLANAWIGLAAAMALDSLFLVVFALVTFREILAGRNWRNLKVVGLVSLLAAANVGYHVEVAVSGASDIALRTAVALVIMLIMLIGGRIVPSFTRNWLARRKAARLPAPFGRYDMAAVAAAGLALIAWVVSPASSYTAAALIAAGGLHLVRLARWAGLSTVAEPLVLILHVGYAFVPVGFFIVGASILWPDAMPPAAALHAWTTGAIALMTLAVMTRASLGQTGHELSADLATRALYVTALIAVCSRLAVAFAPDFSLALLSAAAIAWIAAFGVFVFAYGPKLAQARA